MFEELIARIRLFQAELGFELAKAHDPYRLRRLCGQTKTTMELFELEAERMVKELEGVDEP